MADDRKILWEPSEKQRLFLSATEDEVLYGGAAGGGKSDALLVDALGASQNATEYSSYRAIIFRKSFPELEELIDRSQELYPQVVPGARFDAQSKNWNFPSGAKIRFRYMDHVKDRFKYQGHQYQYIGWDELTQHETDIGYRYLLSRLRGVDNRLSWYVRATCNPGGFGHEWVKERWDVPDDGSQSNFKIQLRKKWWFRRFIPARIDDNKHLADTDYKDQLEMLGEMERKALLDGRWDVAEIQGAIYQEEMREAYNQGRVLNIPIEKGIPVHTFWDLGRSDATAIWFLQRVGLENRFIDYEEGSFKDIEYWAKTVLEKGYLYGEHYMPHDADVKQLSFKNQSRKEMFIESGVKPITVVSRIAALEEGIDQTRAVFPSCFFDRKRCQQGLKALANYRRKFDEKNGTYSTVPLHNWASNGSDAFRQFGQGFVAESPLRKKKPFKRRSNNWKVT